LTVDRFLQRGDLPEPVADDQFVGLGERPINDQAILPRASVRGQPFLEGCIAGSTGVALMANQVTLVFCIQAGKWLTR
jgi:hypothetical protein